MTMHPESHLVGVACSSCGATHTLRSTAATLAVDVCSSCHPAYTGIARASLGGSRVDRFNRRLALSR